ncbi:maker371 [Drosophila busckii]|uniref:Maker371 n=1 Tax=Drosophila busckii TaxID=30019 RepID=A0A0M4EQB2_DROBS|nr:maker371 [Drosophila busckii]
MENDRRSSQGGSHKSQIRRGRRKSKGKLTQKGELLLELKKAGEETAVFRSLVDEAIENQANTLSHWIAIECKDQDEVTMREDICEALRKQMSIMDVVPDDIHLRKAYGQTQTATIKLPADNSKKALHIGAGWMGELSAPGMALGIIGRGYGLAAPAAAYAAPAYTTHLAAAPVLKSAVAAPALVHTSVSGHGIHYGY